MHDLNHIMRWLHYVCLYVQHTCSVYVYMLTYWYKLHGINMEHAIGLAPWQCVEQLYFNQTFWATPICMLHNPYIPVYAESFLDHYTVSCIRSTYICTHARDVWCHSSEGTGTRAVSSLTPSGFGLSLGMLPLPFTWANNNLQQVWGKELHTGHHKRNW